MLAADRAARVTARQPDSGLLCPWLKSVHAALVSCSQQRIPDRVSSAMQGVSEPGLTSCPDVWQVPNFSWWAGSLKAGSLHAHEQQYLGCFDLGMRRNGMGVNPESCPSQAPELCLCVVVGWRACVRVRMHGHEHVGVHVGALSCSAGLATC